MTDKVRASRTGHHFHEAWAARRALELLAPSDDLLGIAVEGLSPADQEDAAQETVEIADLTLYHGDSECTFEACTRQVILQLKYSISRALVPALASDMKKTLGKFSVAEQELLDLQAGAGALQKRHYGVVTNRPFSPVFLAAADFLRAGTVPSDPDVLSQYEQICRALVLAPADRKSFFERLTFQGREADLARLERSNTMRLASWSAGNDAMAAVRLKGLCDLVRKKAEIDGEGCNVISRPDILDALVLRDEKDLLPTPSAFPAVDNPVLRRQTSEILELIPELRHPLIVHGSGGMGKTVLMQSLQAFAPANLYVVLFDCFGGGAYRALEDGRHRLDRGLLHIVNVLAVQGLCDPLLPTQSDPGNWLRSVHDRLAQAVTALRNQSPERLLVLVIDGADNAAQEANDRHELAFPTALLESAGIRGLPDHVRLVLSCRTERRDLLGAVADTTQLRLEGFTPAESAEFIRRHVPDASENDIGIACARSGGNPRVLAHLVRDWNGLVRAGENCSVLTVESLIAQRIRSAIREAGVRRGGEHYLKPFLAGLAVLPPPVPLEAYAQAHGVEVAEAESIFADLGPLLEMTSLGLIFRDEPTETYIRTTYSSDRPSLEALARRLGAVERQSQYAGYALPGLLKRLGDTAAAVALAFSPHFPSQITSDVGRRALRILRINTALSLALRDNDLDTVVALLVEMGTLQRGHANGDKFIEDNPDLVAIADDIDAMRRLFKLQTWRPESRHACLATVNLLKDEQAEAAWHAKRIAEWTRWRRQEKKPSGSGNDVFSDMFALPLFQLARGDVDAFIAANAALPPQAGFAVARRVFTMAQALPDTEALARMYRALREAAVLPPSLAAAALATWIDRDGQAEIALVRHLAAGLVRTPIEDRLRAPNALLDILLDAAALALRHSLTDESRILLDACRLRQPDARAFAGTAHGMDLASWTFYVILSALADGRALSASALFPTRFAELNADDGTDAESPLDIFDACIVPLTDFAIAASRALSSGCPRGGNHAAGLIAAWERLPRRDGEDKRLHTSAKHLHGIGRELTFRILRLCGGFSAANAGSFLQVAARGDAWPLFQKVAVVEYLAAVPETHSAACDLADQLACEIGEDQHTDSRSEAYARLARAIFPAAPDESRAYFRRGLAFVDELAGYDTTFLSQVFEVAAALEGPPLDGERAYRFARLCTSCFVAWYTDNFPWDRFGGAACAVMGVAALALVSQWDHKDQVSLDTSLSSIVTGLLERKQLEAAPALALLALDTPKQWTTLPTDTRFVRRQWDGGLSAALIRRGDLDLATVLDALLRLAESAGASEDGFPSFFLFALRKECENHSAIPRHIAERLGDLLTKNTASRAAGDHEAEAEDEADGARAARHAALIEELDHQLALVEDIAAVTNPCDPAAISQAWSRFDALAVRVPEGTIFDQLKARVSPAQRRGYLLALAAAPLPWDALAAQLSAIEDCLADWSRSSAVQEIRPNLASMLVRADVARVIRHPLGFDMVLARLARLGPGSIESVAKDVVDNICLHEPYVHPSIWMTLGGILARGVGQDRVRAVVERLFDSEMALLAARGPDPDYASRLDLAITAEEAVAGLIWRRLGDLREDRTARAMDAVRLLARHGRWRELDFLAARWNARSAGPYGNEAFPFCFLHARCALTAALGAAALDQPQAMLRYRETFESLLRANPFHPIVGRTARRALEAMGVASAPSYSDTAADRTGPAVQAGPAGAVFANDMRPCRELAEIFRVDADVVAAMAARRLAEWDPDAMHIHKDDELLYESFGNIRDYKIASARRRYEAHLRFHACLATACELEAASSSQHRQYDRARLAAFIGDCDAMAGSNC